MQKFTDMSIADNTTTTHVITVTAVESYMPPAQETGNPDNEDMKRARVVAGSVGGIVVALFFLTVVILVRLYRKRTRARPAAVAMIPLVDTPMPAPAAVPERSPARQSHELTSRDGQEEGVTMARE